jgi:hypothetical protein
MFRNSTGLIKKEGKVAVKSGKRSSKKCAKSQTQNSRIRKTHSYLVADFRPSSGTFF